MKLSHRKTQVNDKAGICMQTVRGHSPHSYPPHGAYVSDEYPDTEKSEIVWSGLKFRSA